MWSQVSIAELCLDPSEQTWIYLMPDKQFLVWSKWDSYLDHPLENKDKQWNKDTNSKLIQNVAAYQIISSVTGINDHEISDKKHVHRYW